jgi:hypothetical protein
LAAPAFVPGTEQSKDRVMSIFTPEQWIIAALVFVLGMLVGLFLTSGGRKKWKTRYYDERKRLEDREKYWSEQEREWRERDSLRAAAVKDRDNAPDERPL